MNQEYIKQEKVIQVPLLKQFYDVLVLEKHAHKLQVVQLVDEVQHADALPFEQTPDSILIKHSVILNDPQLVPRH